MDIKAKQKKVLLDREHPLTLREKHLVAQAKRQLHTDKQ